MNYETQKKAPKKEKHRKTFGSSVFLCVFVNAVGRARTCNPQLSRVKIQQIQAAIIAKLAPLIQNIKKQKTPRNGQRIDICQKKWPVFGTLFFKMDLLQGSHFGMNWGAN